MSGVDGSRASAATNDRGRDDAALALIQSLHGELGEALRAVAWYSDGDLGLLYARSGVEAREGRLRSALRRRQPPIVEQGQRKFEYAIDAYEGVAVVTLSARVFVPPAGDAAGVALSVERDDRGLPAVTTAIERAIAAYRRVR